MTDIVSPRWELHEQVAQKKKRGAVPDVKIDLRDTWETYADDVFNYIFRRGMPTREDAEDLTSDVFVEYYKNPGAFRGESGIRTWLYGIADNLRRDFYRRKKRVLRVIPYDESDEDNPMRVFTEDMFGQTRGNYLDVCGDNHHIKFYRHHYVPVDNLADRILYQRAGRPLQGFCWHCGKYYKRNISQ